MCRAEGGVQLSAAIFEHVEGEIPHPGTSERPVQ